MEQYIEKWGLLFVVAEPSGDSSLLNGNVVGSKEVVNDVREHQGTDGEFRLYNEMETGTNDQQQMCDELGVGGKQPYHEGVVVFCMGDKGGRAAPAGVDR